MDDETFCAAASEACGEGLAGTAIERCRFMVCVSFSRAWPRKILDGPQLPESTIALLASLDRLEHVRVQYLRHSEAVDSEGLSVLVADTRRGKMRRWQVSDYAALDAIDWSALDRQELPAGGVEVTGSAVLVCTHGKRDRCCAKWGGAFWRELMARHNHATVEIWQTSHLGGHRFAPTAVVLPWGFQYGRLSHDDAIGLLESAARGEVYRTDLLRGRIAWSAPEQVAEIEARVASEALAANAVMPVHVASVQEPQGGTAWEVTVNVDEHARVWRVVRTTDPQRQRPPSCGKPVGHIASWKLTPGRPTPVR